MDPLSDQPLGFLSGAARLERRFFYEGELVWRSARRMYGERKTREASANAMSFASYLCPALGLSPAPPPFWRPREGAVDEALREVQAAPLLQILGQCPKDAV